MIGFFVSWNKKSLNLLLNICYMYCYFRIIEFSFFVVFYKLNKELVVIVELSYYSNVVFFFFVLESVIFCVVIFCCDVLFDNIFGYVICLATREEIFVIVVEIC